MEKIENGKCKMESVKWIFLYLVFQSAAKKLSS
jgi:hypothetical protein